MGNTQYALSRGERRACLVEALLIYSVTLVLIRVVISLNEAGSLSEDYLVLVPCFFLYIPIAVLLVKKRSFDDFGLRLGRFKEAVRLNLLLILVIFPPFILLNHLYQTILFGHTPGHGIPEKVVDILLYHFLFVGLPEEFYYRGFLQSLLNRAFYRKFILFGVPFGWGMIIAAALFAAGHSVVSFRWWHFSIFFPSLLFGLMREKTGNALAPAIFHAVSNMMMTFLDTYYGIIPS